MHSVFLAFNWYNKIKKFQYDLLSVNEEFIRRYCRTSGYEEKENELCFILRPCQTKLFISCLGTEIIDHPTLEDKETHALVCDTCKYVLDVLMKYNKYLRLKLYQHFWNNITGFFICALLTEFVNKTLISPFQFRFLYSIYLRYVYHSFVIRSFNQFRGMFQIQYMYMHEWRKHNYSNHTWICLQDAQHHILYKYVNFISNKGCCNEVNKLPTNTKGRVPFMFRWIANVCLFNTILII